MTSRQEIENSFKKNVNELIEAFNKVNNENMLVNDELQKKNAEYEELKKDYDENVVKLEEENAILNIKVKDYEAHLKKAIMVEFKIEEFLKSITELKNISGEAKNELTEPTTSNSKVA